MVHAGAKDTDIVEPSEPRFDLIFDLIKVSRDKQRWDSDPNLAILAIRAGPFLQHTLIFSRVDAIIVVYDVN